MKTQITRFKNWQIAVLISYPLLYVINSFMPWSYKLWGEHNHDYYILFLISTIVLHWTATFLIFYFIRSNGMNLKDVGYTLNTKGTLIFVISYLFIALGIYFFTEMSLNYVSIDEAKLAGLDNFYPRTSTERMLWIFLSFTAGFCEELHYRGFAINALMQKKFNKWLAIPIASLLFVIMHGLSGFLSIEMFLYYFLAGVIFSLIFVLTKRLWIPMLIHMLYDLMAMMAIFQVTQQ